MERKVLLQALTGSHNYNLQTEDSDRDYKVFVAPTFDDLYNNRYHKQNLIKFNGENVDKDIKDIRQLSDLLWKSNIAYLELLFSKELTYDKSNDSLRKLFDLKDEIVKMNLPQLFKSTGGMFNQRMKKLDKGSDGTQHLVDKYGYNTKEAMHTYRSIDLLIRYYDNGFKNFGEALWYEDGSDDKKYVMHIKNGGFCRHNFEGFITEIHDTLFAPMKEDFYAQKPNTELKEYIDSLIKDVVQDGIFYELYAKSH
jgi:uncharacterized protein